MAPTASATTMLIAAITPMVMRLVAAIWPEVAPMHFSMAMTRALPSRCARTALAMPSPPISSALSPMRSR